jgi:hypothetical protein
MRAVAGWSRERTEGVAAIAWAAALPWAALTLGAVFLLGPALGHLIYPSRLAFTPLPNMPWRFAPKPVEDTRFLLAVAGAVLSPAVVACACRWSAARATPGVRRASVGIAQLAVVVLVAVAIRAQHERPWQMSFFNRTALLVGVVGALVLAGAVRALSARIAVGARRSHALRAAFPLVAATATAVWLLPGVNTAESLTWSFHAYEVPFHLDETFAVLNGLTPYVDFNAQYTSLLSYLIAGSMLLFGKSVLVFTATLCAISAVALVAVYDLLRRILRSPAAALALYLPFMATSLFAEGVRGLPFTPGIVRFTPGTYFQTFPLRYCGPYLLAWLLARHVERRQARTWPLFVAAGLVVLNNPEFGIPALGALVVAMLLTTIPPGARHLLRFGGEALLGLALAAALVALVTLLRAGSLPHLERAIFFSRLYGMSGFASAPLPAVLGLPLVVYATYAAAIGVAAVRAIERASGRILTAMLAWSGVFGLGSAAYWVARPHETTLPTTFSAWALSLVLLAVVAVRQLASRPSRLPSLATLAVLFGLVVTACSVAQLPFPWQQVQRIRRPPAGTPAAGLPSPLDTIIEPNGTPEVRRFVSSLADGPHRFVVRRGAPIALFATAGHLIADAYGVVNVVPYTGGESIHTREQLDASLDALRAAGGNTALVPVELLPKLAGVLEQRGFAIVTSSGLRRTNGTDRSTVPDTALAADDLTKWVDLRHLHPAALR